VKRGVFHKSRFQNFGPSSGTGDPSAPTSGARRVSGCSRPLAAEHSSRLEDRDEGGIEELTMKLPAKEKKTAEELAVMIREDLGKMDGCPKRGVTVTVYGLNPWNAMLRFGADAGPVPNKAELDSFFEIIVERLKRLYDVSV
jgi:hypothetical protein